MLQVVVKKLKDILKETTKLYQELNELNKHEIYL